MFVSATWAQVKPLPTPQARKRMVQAVDKTLQEGPHAKLPPHLSTLLGLSQEQECPVRQGVVRTGKVVQGFDVSTSNPWTTFPVRTTPCLTGHSCSCDRPSKVERCGGNFACGPSCKVLSTA